MDRPTDIEIAVNRWDLATRLEDIIREIEGFDLTGPHAVKNACWGLGQTIGRLDFLIAELRNTTVNINE